MNNLFDYYISCLAQKEIVNIETLFSLTNHPKALERFFDEKAQRYLTHRDVDTDLVKCAVLQWCCFFEEQIQKNKMHKIYLKNDSGMGEDNPYIMYQKTDKKSMDCQFLENFSSLAKIEGTHGGFVNQEEKYQIILDKHLTMALVNCCIENTKEDTYNILITKKNTEQNKNKRYPEITIEDVEKICQGKNILCRYVDNGILMPLNFRYSVMMEPENYLEKIDAIEKHNNIAGVREKIKIQQSIILTKTNSSSKKL